MMKYEGAMGAEPGSTAEKGERIEETHEIVAGYADFEKELRDNLAKTEQQLRELEAGTFNEEMRGGLVDMLRGTIDLHRASLALLADRQSAALDTQAELKEGLN